MDFVICKESWNQSPMDTKGQLYINKIYKDICET